MAEFIPFDKNVMVNGQTVATIINAFPDYFGDMAKELLKEQGIDNLEPGKWYEQKRFLNAFKELSDNFGSNTLYEIGKAIPSNAKFPTNITSLEKALHSINEAYQLNHQGGEIGFYKLVEFRPNIRKAIMHCKNPYPCDFDRGIITSMARKFRPKNSDLPETKLDPNKPSRKDGADESWYIITW